MHALAMSKSAVDDIPLRSFLQVYPVFLANLPG
jgi:hypothetical protein